MSRGFPPPRLREFIRLWQTTHVFCSPHYPQSNGKLKRFHRTLKKNAIRPLTPLDLADAKRITGDFINYYNSTRLHSAIGFIARFDRLNARHQAIHAARYKKLEDARLRRKIARSNPPKTKNQHQTIPILA